MYVIDNTIFTINHNIINIHDRHNGCLINKIPFGRMYPDLYNNNALYFIKNNHTVANIINKDSSVERIPVYYSDNYLLIRNDIYGYPYTCSSFEIKYPTSSEIRTQGYYNSLCYTNAITGEAYYTPLIKDPKYHEFISCDDMIYVINPYSSHN